LLILICQYIILIIEKIFSGIIKRYFLPAASKGGFFINLYFITRISENADLIPGRSPHREGLPLKASIVRGFLP
jgi:hypothetical protein